MCDEVVDTLQYIIMARRRHGRQDKDYESETHSSTKKSDNDHSRQNGKSGKVSNGQGQDGGSGSLLAVLAAVTMVICVTGGVLYMNKDLQDVVYSTFKKYATPSSSDDNVEEIITEPNTEKKDAKVRDEMTQGETTQSILKKAYLKESITNSADNRIRKELDEADDLFAKGDHAGAMDKYNFIIKRYPNSPRAHHGRGEALNKMAETQRSNALLEEAIKSLRKVIDLPDVPEELIVKAGRSAAQQMNFRGWSKHAAAVMRRLADLFPTNTTLKNELGVAYLLSHKNKEAKDVFQEVLNLDPTDGYAQVHMGFILKSYENDPVKGIPLLKAGIESRAPGTDDGRFYFHLGDGLHRAGKKAEAYNVYREGAERGHFRSIYQRSLYNVEHLVGRPWWTAEQTGYQKYLKMLEDNWQTIRDEGLAQMDPKTGAFLPEEENLRETGDWKQFTLYQRGQRNQKNCAKAPKTCALVDQIPEAKGCKRGQVKYSVMHPGVHVWPHCGPTNCRIRAHLGLVVPKGPRISVAGTEGMWTEGKFIIFDDSFEHEVWHEGSSLRLVLIVDFWHPELTKQEKQTLSPI